MARASTQQGGAVARLLSNTDAMLRPCWQTLPLDAIAQVDMPVDRAGLELRHVHADLVPAVSTTDVLA
jgi:hypothetical protein